jgi:ankyrin repeat protein
MHSGQEVIEALKETYDEIFEKNTQGEHSYALAKQTFSWLMCSFQPLSFKALFAAVAIWDPTITPKLITKISSNFLVIDKEGIARFAHLSVSEYLTAKVVNGDLEFKPVNAHQEATIICLKYLRDMSGNFGQYAFEWWLSHWSRYAVSSSANVLVEKAARLPHRYRHRQREMSQEVIFESGRRLRQRPVLASADGTIILGPPSTEKWFGPSRAFFELIRPFLTGNIHPGSHDPRALEGLYSVGRRLVICILLEDTYGILYLPGSCRLLLAALRSEDNYSKPMSISLRQFKGAERWESSDKGLRSPYRDATLAIMVMNGLNVNARDWLGRSIAHHAVLNLCAELSMFLFGVYWEEVPSEDEHVDLGTNYWLPPDFEDIRTVARKELDINTTDDDGNTPLHLAIKRYNVPAIRTLLGDSRTDPNIKDIYGVTPLHTASSFSLEITKLVLANPRITADEEDFHGRTALNYACNAEILVTLIEDGRVNPRASDAKRRTTTSSIALGKRLQHRLGVPTINFSAQGRTRLTSLDDAVLFDKSEVIEIILEKNDESAIATIEDPGLKEGVEIALEGLREDERSEEMARQRKLTHKEGKEMQDLLTAPRLLLRIFYELLWNALKRMIGGDSSI